MKAHEVSAQTHTIIRLIRNRRCKLLDIRYAYQCALLMHEDFVEWPIVNAAILKRWSATGLKRIQRAEKE